MELKVTGTVRVDCDATGHISAVLMSGSTYSVEHVGRLMEAGHVVFTESDDGERATVEGSDCDCRERTLRSVGGAVGDRNLTYLT